MNINEFKTALHAPSNEGFVCPVSKTLELLNGKWTSRIIYKLQKQDFIRFGALKKRIPDITNTMISNTLKQLEDSGFVKREQFNEIPPHVEYSLTPAGLDMLPILKCQNGEKNIFDFSILKFFERKRHQPQPFARSILIELRLVDCDMTFSF